MAANVRVKSVVAPDPGRLEEGVNDELARLEQARHTVRSVEFLLRPLGDAAEYAAFIVYEVAPVRRGLSASRATDEPG